MNKILPLLWVTTFIWVASTGPLPQRHHRPNYGTKFLNTASTRSRRTTTDTTTAATTTSTTSPPPTITTTSIRNSKRVAPDAVKNVAQIPTRVPTVDIIPAIKNRGRGSVPATANNGSKIVSGENETVSSPPLDHILNYNYDYDYVTFLYDLDYLDIDNETRTNDSRGKRGSAIMESLREGKILNNELFLNPKPTTDQKREFIKELRLQAGSMGGKRPRLKVPRPFRYTTPLPDQKRKSVSKEPSRNKTPSSPLLNKQHLRSSKTAEVATPTKGQITRNISSVSSNSSSSDPRIKAGWTAESSVSVEVRVESSYQKGYKIPHHYFVSVSESPFRRAAPNNKNLQTIQETQNNMRLREVLELEVSATPKIVDLRPGVPSTEQTRTTSETTTASSMRNKEVKKSVSTTTPRNKVATTITTVFPSAAEVFVESVDLTTESLTPSHETTTSRPASSRKIINAPSSPVATRGNISQRRSSSLNPRNSPTSRSRSNRRGRIPGSLVPRKITSQLGINPHGLHPSGITPFGIHPQGIFPFGLSPYGLSPLGHNNTRIANGSASITITPPKITKENQTANSTDDPADGIKEERYHVQVTKPDGSINGDYVVLDPNTGSLSGVRYEAIDGADQDLIQQALLSFLSLDPRLDPRPKTSQSNLRPRSSSSSSVSSRQVEIRSKKKMETSRSESRRSQRPKRTGLLGNGRINDRT